MVRWPLQYENNQHDISLAQLPLVANTVQGCAVLIGRLGRSHVVTWHTQRCSVLAAEQNLHTDSLHSKKYLYERRWNIGYVELHTYPNIQLKIA